ncbi:MAG: acyl-CoA dehydrogenase [Solirubrobacterales bacterium]
MTLTVTAGDRALLVDAARGFARRELLPAAARLDHGDREATHRCWESVCALGLDRALLDEEAGGAGLPPGVWLALIEELAAAEAGLALAVALHALALRALPPDAAAAVPTGARWALVPAPAARDHIVLGAAGADGLVLGGHAGGPPAVLEPGGDWSVTADPRQLGLRAAPAGVVRSDGAVPPAGVVRGDDAIPPAGVVRGDDAIPPAGVVRDDDAVPPAPAPAVEALLYAATAAVAIGIVRRAYELATDYAATRHQGGGPIGHYGAVRQMLAAMAVRLEARPRMPAEETDLRAALAAKVAASHAAGRTTIDAVQVFGGSGYIADSGVEKLMRDAKYCELYPEPNWRARARLLSAA